MLLAILKHTLISISVLVNDFILVTLALIFLPVPAVNHVLNKLCLSPAMSLSVLPLPNLNAAVV